MKIFRCRIGGLVGDDDQPLPVTVIVEAQGVATAKVEAATAVNGYWTEESDCEIIAVLNAEEGITYPKVVEVIQNEQEKEQPVNNETQSPLIWWLDNNFGPQVNTKAKEVVNLLSSLVIGVAYTSGIGGDEKDLHARYMKLIKTTFSGLYDSGDATNFDEAIIAAVYAHLTGENFADLQNEWAADMERALAQNRAFFAAQENAL